MNSSHNIYDTIENLIFNQGLRISSLKFSDSLDKMFAHLTNDLILVIPTQLFPNLNHANKATLSNFRLIAGGTGIYWPDLDEDLSLKGFLKEYLRQRILTEKELVLS